jgi:hypothetical protein
MSEDILRRQIERKTEDVLGEDQFGFKRGKGSKGCDWDAENNIATNFGHGELCTCFID